MRNDELYLIDIMEACSDIARFLELPPLEGQQDDSGEGVKAAAALFEGDDKSRSAVLAKLIVIGEAANKVAESTQSIIPSVPWRDIIRFRNVLVRQYFKVDQEIVWQIVSTQIIPLHQAVMIHLKQSSPELLEQYIQRRRAR